MTVHRLATPDDLEAVHSIYMHEEVIPFLGVDPMPLAEFAPVLNELIATNDFYVVESDGRLVGFYRASRHTGRASHVAYIGTFAIMPSARGTGIAEAIIEQAISRLNARGVSRVELMVEADNPRGQRFYSRLGFVCEGTMRCAYKRSSDAHYTDEIFMARLLPPLAAASGDA